MTRRLTGPQIRDLLHLIANSIEDEYGAVNEARALDWLAEETRRRKAVRQGPRKAKVTTHALRAQARQIARERPDLVYREIGAMLGIDGGRVSEAVAGFRDQEIK